MEENIEKKHDSIFERISNWWQEKKTVEVKVLPANKAFCRTTYGCEMDAKKLIQIHRNRINNLIVDKSTPDKITDSSQGNLLTDYYCIYSFPENVANYIDEILSVFIENGYKVVNLSNIVEDIVTDNVYLIGWYREKF